MEGRRAVKVVDPKDALRQMVDYMARTDWDTALERAIAVAEWGKKGGVMPRMSELERDCYRALIDLDIATHEAKASLADKKHGHE